MKCQIPKPPLKKNRNLLININKEKNSNLKTIKYHLSTNNNIYKNNININNNNLKNYNREHLKTQIIEDKINKIKNSDENIYINNHCLKYEFRLFKLKKLKPSKSLQNFNTINWFKRLIPKKNYEKAINDLLEENDKIIINSPSNNLDNNIIITDNNNNNNDSQYNRSKSSKYLHPKYLLSYEFYKKILKLKSLFLEFEHNNDHHMEIENFLLLFETNNIKLTKKELLGLFKNTTYKKIYLDFYHFCSFTLKHEREFRLFMRKLSEKQKELNKNENSNYFPRSFNLLLDYFLAMGEERKSINKIQAKIDNMKNIQKNFPKTIDDINEFINENKKFNFKEILYEFKKLISMVCNEKNYFNLKLNEKLNKFNKNNLKKNIFSKKLSNSIEYNDLLFNNVKNEHSNNKKINKKNSFFDKKSVSSKKLNFSGLKKFLNLKNFSPLKKQFSKNINDKSNLFANENILRKSFNFSENHNNNFNNDINIDNNKHLKSSSKFLPILKQSKSIDSKTILNYNFKNK